MMSTEDKYFEYLDEVLIYIIDRQAKSRHISTDGAYNLVSKYNNYKADFGTTEEHVSFSDIKSSLIRIASKGLLQHRSDPFTGGYFSILPVLAEHVQFQLNEDHSVIWKCSQLPEYVVEIFKGLGTAKENNFIEQQNLDAIEGENIDDDVDAWKPIPLERSGAEFEKLEASIENAIEVVRGSNGYPEIDFDERDSILTSLRIGLEALKNKSSGLKQLKPLLIEPLNLLNKKFAEAAIGHAAKLAINALFHWLGIK